MPSARSNKLAIEAKIRQLQEREAANNGLSESNAAFLDFLQQWKRFAGTDPLIVIQPKGALLRSGQLVPAKLIRVTDQVAADLFAFAGKRQQLVRLATEEETERYEKHVRAQQEAARGRAAAERAALARNQLAALLGHESVPFVEPAPGNMSPGVLEVAFHGDAPDASALVPTNLGDAPASASASDTEKNGAHGFDEIAGKGTARKLLAAGITTIEQLAASSPEDLVKLGIAPRTAAALITDATEVIASRVQAGDVGGEGAGAEA